MVRTVLLGLGMLALSAAGCGTAEKRGPGHVRAEPGTATQPRGEEPTEPKTARAIAKWIDALRSDDPRRNVPALRELVKMGRAGFPALVRALETGDANQRAGAAQALGGIGDRAATGPLITALEDPHWTVRYYAVRALETLEDPDATGPLIEALKDRGRLIGDYSARALGRIGDPRAVEALVEALKGDDVLLYMPAEEALKEIGKPSIGPLVLALRGPHVIARRFATFVLGEIGGDGQVVPLVEALKDADDSVRWGAAVALGKIGDRRAVGPLIEVLRDPDFKPQLDVREALEKITTRDFGFDPDPWSRWWEEAKASGWEAPHRTRGTGEEGAREPGKAPPADPAPWRIRELVSRLESGDTRIYVDAVNALVEIGEPAVIPLVDALGHEKPMVRRHAAWALGKLGDARAVATLIEALEDGDPVVRASAAGALGRMRETRAVDRIVPLLSDPEKETIHVAAAALGEIGDVTAVGALIAALRRPGEELREVVITILTVMEPPPVEPLAGLLWDVDGGLRRMVLESLGEIADKRAARWLIPLLKDEDAEIRAGTVRALGQIEDRRAVEPLIALLDDPIPEVRLCAVRALGSFHDRRAVGPLVSALADEAVREDAADSLKTLTNLDLGEEAEPWKRWYEAQHQLYDSK